MSAASNRLFDVRLKTERAKQHIRDTESAIRAFRMLDPYRVGTQFDAETGNKVYYMTRVEDPPPHISCIAGDALNNFRSALDHLAMRLSIAGGGGPDDWLYYPVFDSATDYEAKKSGKVGSMRQDAIDFIDATQPYKGGAGHRLWVLNKLNNIDKHRRLNVVGTHFGGFWTHPDMLRLLREGEAKGAASVATSLPPGEYFRPMDRRDALKVGHVLYICPPHVNVEDQTEFTFDVAFDEPGVVECEPILPLLHELAHLVDGIIDRSVPLL